MKASIDFKGMPINTFDKRGDSNLLPVLNMRMRSRMAGKQPTRRRRSKSRVMAEGTASCERKFRRRHSNHRQNGKPNGASGDPMIRGGGRAHQDAGLRGRVGGSERRLSRGSLVVQRLGDGFRQMVHGPRGWTGLAAE